MRKTGIIIFVALTILSCGKPNVGERLDILERFIVVNPDSVYQMLLEMEEDRGYLAQEDKMHYLVLRAQCHNQLDLPFDSIDFLREAADYYRVNGNPNEKLRAGYLLGRAYHVLGDTPMAQEIYYDCLAEVDSSYKNLDYIQLSKVHSQLADIYHKHKLSRYELTELRHAEQCALKGNDSYLTALYHELSAKPYDMEGNHDSVIVISHESARMYHDIGATSASARALEGAVFAYLQQGKYAEAKRCMDIYEKESGDVDENGNVLTEAKIYYHKKGLYYLEINKNDSADYYFHKLISETHDANDLEAAYRGLLMLYRKVGNNDSIGKYSQLYCEANDSSNKHSVRDDILRMKSMYDYTRYKNQLAQKEIQSQVTHKKILVAVFLLVIIAMCIVFYIVQNNKQKKNEVGLLLTEYNRLKSLIEGFNEDKESQLEKQRKELVSIRESLKSKAPEYGVETKVGVDIDVVRKFKYASSLSPAKCIATITMEDWQLLIKEMMSSDKDFMLYLSKMGLSDGEKNVSLLMRLRFSDYEIKRIMNIFGNSLTNYKTKINKKLFNQAGAKTLRRLIYEFK